MLRGALDIKDFLERVRRKVFEIMGDDTLLGDD